MDKFREKLSELSNWGRWGPDDELGALNLITPDAIQSASRLVALGETVSCGRPLRVGPTETPGTEFVHHMLASGEGAPSSGFMSTSDWFGSGIHGFTYTHIDSPAHIVWDSTLYNGHPASSCTTTRGASKCGVEVSSGGITTRGIFFDGPKFFEKSFLDAGNLVTAADLDAWFLNLGIQPRAGDALIIRLGRDQSESEKRHDSVGKYPGLASDVADWLRLNDTALLASDHISDSLTLADSECRLPIHVLTIVGLGMWLIDNAELGALSRRCNELGVYEFLFLVAPLVMRHATGSLVNPIAVF
jgi:kynurenine formamidase